MQHTLRTLAALALCASATVLTTGCANMSHRQQNAAIGAGVGAVAGSILTGGSTLGTLGGAAIGGVIGHGSGSDRQPGYYGNGRR